ncbi:hypothetical protein [Deinococcus pimensis]|uniref:hypothetical protein n=1 Tax=Deinococcus pimensis TaxID=309888 RepID=UPI00047FE818|nr:hypothetical protein [Deinococcus pimensis]
MLALTGRRALLIALASTLLGTASTSRGVQAVLSDAQIRQAMEAGRAMVSPQNGYLYPPYVLKEYTSGLRIDPNTPIVDAVTVGTPFERVRYDSYLVAYQRKPVQFATAQQVARANANRLTFVLYTHSPYSVEQELEAWQQAYVQHAPGEAKVQRTYLDDFKPATLTVNGQTFTSRVRINGPFQDAFSIKGKPEFRYLGVIFHEFDLTPLVRAGQLTGMADLRFKDATGRTYAERVDLARYR